MSIVFVDVLRPRHPVGLWAGAELVWGVWDMGFLRVVVNCAGARARRTAVQVTLRRGRLDSSNAAEGRPAELRS
ncbi:hypothetical protein [Leucobacter sp. Psy1]|uniref:hypothetical protein n=1 Tax=Leucobacter sp. Psy1 TaxID=2875729 RepID=UPI001CD6593C|nr:hypothetical protein [Leucobacter sp. Psy1]